MSTDSSQVPVREGVRRAFAHVAAPRMLALGATALLLFAFGSVLYSVVDIVGDPTRLVVLVMVTLVAATACSRVLPVKTAFGFAVVLLGGGLWVYVTAIPASALDLLRHIGTDLASLLSGLSVLRLQAIEVWTLSVTPAPVFLTWYLALRRRYVAAVTIGGAALCFFVLTGDIETTTALFGALGAVGVVGFGRLDRFDVRLTPGSAGEDDGETDGVDSGRRAVLVELGAVAAVSSTVSVVPGNDGEPVELLGSGGQQTLEGNLVSDDQRVTLQGAIELGPEVRFRVESSRASYWRAGGYDRYTGDGWVRTGTQTEFTGRAETPPGPTETVQQRYQIESRLNTMPAVWQPVSVGGERSDNARRSEAGGLQPATPFTPGDRYTVTSERTRASPADLAEAGTGYPAEIREQYTQLPDSTPERVAERTERITANAETPYETARVLEQWLGNNYAYSLDVDRPDGDVVDAFLFEMDAGYCTYFATTMVAMLRTQGVPARFVVGYSTGERDDDEWVVRGLHSHAWVEVYFPRYGWVQFDPTPAGPRDQARQERLADEGLVDRPEEDSPDESDSQDDEETETTETETGGEDSESATTPPTDPNIGPSGLSASAGDERVLPELPSREQVALGSIVLAGLVAGARQTGLSERLSRALWLRYQPRSGPATDIERAFERLELLLARDHRPRGAEETPRQYLAAIDADDRAWRVYELYERTRYAGEGTAEMADEAVAIVDELVADRGLRGGD